MSYSSGSYAAPSSSWNPAIDGTDIDAADWAALLSDLSVALSTCMLKDGTQAVTANLPMSGFKLTGLGNGSAASDSATISNIQNATGIYVGTVGGTTDVITLTPIPAITGYGAGKIFSFIASGANTVAPTVNVSALGAKSITKGGATALVAGDLPFGALIAIQYDGTQFQLLNTPGATYMPLSGGTMTGALNEVQGADIASATTTNLQTATGNYIHVTGTTAITAITLSQGARRTVEFTGALTLTNGASLILPGGANIVTAAGDTAVFIGEASSVVRCVSYTKASGAPVLMSPITNSLSGDVAMNDSTQYFTGPTVAQGTGGSWFASGGVTVVPTSTNCVFDIKLWDGTTVIDSTQEVILVNAVSHIALSGPISSPAGNIRISVKDTTDNFAKILANQSGNSMDSTLTAIRIG